MAHEKKVIKTVIKDIPKVLHTEEKTALAGQGATQLAESLRKEIEARQEEIDYYNNVICNEQDDYFDRIQLMGKDIIVQLHKENYIKAVTETAPGVPFYDAWISQVDGRMRQTHDAKWVDNPLPYVFTGVVRAISPTVQADMLKEKQAIAAVNPSLAANYKVLQVGDIVHLSYFMFADVRFYKDKQCRDFIKNPEEFRLEYWEGLVKIYPGLIEGIEKDKAAFMEYTKSPYSQWKEYIKGMN